MPNPDDIPDEEAELAGYRRQTPEDLDAEEERKLRVQLRTEFLLNCMRNDLFREWLMERLLGFNTFSAPFGATPTGFPDPLATWYAAGLKAAGWSLWEEFDNLAPDLASKMRRGE